MCVLVYECVHVCARKSVQVQVHICSKRMRAFEERGREQEHICELVTSTVDDIF